MTLPPETKKRAKLRVLVACEESQAICKAFRALGHEAYSCDILPCSGGHPEWHIQDDVLRHLDDGWDLMIGHPPCTYLSKAGAVRLYRGGKINQERLSKGKEAKEFFMKLLDANIPLIAVENPTPLKIYELPKYTQVIQPYQFGHPFSKRTLLWLKGLPNLKATDVKTDYTPFLPSNTGGKKRGQKAGTGKERVRDPKLSSKTFEGVANAMAEQWGGSQMTLPPKTKDEIIEEEMKVLKNLKYSPMEIEASLTGVFDAGVDASRLATIQEIRRKILSGCKCAMSWERTCGKDGDLCKDCSKIETVIEGLDSLVEGGKK